MPIVYIFGHYLAIDSSGLKDMCNKGFVPNSVLVLELARE